MPRPNVLEEVDEWCRGRSADLEPIYQLAGGWEAWAQVELALYFVPKATRVEREVKVYADNVSRADIVLYHAGDIAQIVEFKCHSQVQDSAATNNFARRVESDITKYNTRPLKPEYANAEYYVFGISCNTTVRNATEAYFRQPGKPRVLWEDVTADICLFFWRPSHDA